MLRYFADNDEDYNSTYRWKTRIENLIISISKKVENYLGYSLDIQSRTEYHDVNHNQQVFFTKAQTIQSLTSLYVDYTGLWDGSTESEIDDCYVGIDNKSVVLPVKLSQPTQKGVRIIYTGGLAYDGVKTRITVDDTTDWTVNRYAVGGTSGAVGIVSSVIDGTALSIENLQGIFEAGETISQHSYEDPASRGSASATAVISTIDRPSLVESYPDIVLAAEIEINYHFKHKNDYEMITDNRDGTSLRRDRFRKPETPFIEEVMQLLNPYRTVVL